MPLTAYDPTTSSIIRPGNTSATPQCRDPQCRANLHLVKRTPERVAHFRHSVHSDCPNRDSIREKEAMSPWHIWWQQQCDTPDRIEYTHTDPGGDRRRADIVTLYDWCIEVQHSAIAPTTIRARENHWSGRVLWLIDAASADRRVDLSIDAESVRLSGDGWVAHLTTLIAVDDGAGVWLFPEFVARDGGELAASTDRVRCYTREEFAATWINATSAPFVREPKTRWRWDTARRRKVRSAAEAREREAAAEARIVAEMQATYVCEYTGNEANLIHDFELQAPANDPVAAALTAVRVPDTESQWPIRTELSDIGPCATCQTAIVRYGPHGRALCLLCQRKLNERNST